MAAYVVHRRDAATIPAGDYVYCGRPSKWGNPYAIGSSYGHRLRLTRLDAIRAFERYWYSDQCEPLRAAALIELKDKACGCWCHPRPCHVEIIVDYVNAHYAATV